MGQQQIPPFLVFVCPLGCKDRCPKKWKNRFIDHAIFCLCKCHNDNKDLK